ncbi:efflux RND transporter periplasmic adaptor subunit [Piscinibacter sakaiensis]|uniref:efflux RND transporter periplasmic adaptor subunit n=1 Tax=Piscinibacter sakaiensis TaxID=1547922 RepID=UPI003AAA6897
MTAPLTAAAQAAVQRARPVVVTPPAETVPGTNPVQVRHNRLLSMPLVSGDRTLGAVALAVDASDGNAINNLFESLTQASAGIGDQLAAPQPVDAGRNDAGTVLQLQDGFLRQSRLAEAATALVSELAALLGCDRVTLGLVDAGELNVIAVSNSAEFKPNQELLRMIAAAMQETADQGHRVVYPVASTDPIRIVLAHAALHERAGQSLASVPLVHDGKAIGALLAEWRGTSPAQPAHLDLLDSLGCAIGPLLALRQRAERAWTARFADQVRAATARLTRRDDPLPKIASAALLLVVLASLFVPITHRVGAPARIEGAVQRIVAAPLDGYLAKTHVRPGDTVRAGDVLVELADQDLLLEQRRWEGALAQQENAYAAALARSDRAQFVITQGKAGEARAQLDLVRQQLSRARLVAPIDGVVIKGDLSQGLGAPVQRGDTLITLAPAEQFRLIVNVDERDVAHIQPGQSGRLALASTPGDPLAFVVERVTPVAAVHDGRNAFEVEARLLAAAPLLRPGLQGVAKIDAGERSLAWIWSHRAIDWLRLSLWSWIP